MSKKSVEDLLAKGAADKKFRIKFDQAKNKEVFVEHAIAEGFDFTEEELTEVLRENGDIFESFGNPPKRSIWI